jgi:hypothetical protein
MWIFCCGMQRSGSTVQFQIAAQLVEEAKLGKRVEWVKAERFPELRQKYAEYPGWKVFKHHICTDEMASEFHQRTAMGVYVYRDLRDVCVSTMHKYSMTFEQLWDSGFLADCLQQFQKWTSLPRMLVSKYEEVVRDLPREVERIATHLGMSLEPQRYEQIAAEYVIAKQMQRIEDAKRAGRLQQGFADALFDPHTNLHTNHIHSGEIGSWKEVLSADQIAVIENSAHDWLAMHGYELTQSSLYRTWLTFRYQQKRTTQAVMRKLCDGVTLIRR